MTVTKERISNQEFSLFARYATSKLIQLLVFRELSRILTQPKRGRIITSMVNPGAAATDIVRDDVTFAFKAFTRATRFILRTAEEGSRTLVHGAEGNRDTDGMYLEDCKPARSELYVGRTLSCPSLSCEMLTRY